MIKGVIIVALIIFLLFIYSLAVTAKRADRDMAKLLEDIHRAVQKKAGSHYGWRYIQYRKYNRR